jgi:hypothetical protein
MSAEKPPVPVNVGDVLLGKYRVERVLGVGGMGVVVAATHLDLFELRAIKFMIPSALSDAEAVERFLREARAAARLKSEHVAKVHDVGRLENGSPYMVMEYLEGSDLNDLAKRYGSLPPANVAAPTPSRSARRWRRPTRSASFTAISSPPTSSSPPGPTARPASRCWTSGSPRSSAARRRAPSSR